MAKEVLKQTPRTVQWWKDGWMIGVVCLVGLGVGTGGVAWKAGFFNGADHDKPAVAEKSEWTPQATKAKPKPSRLDLYGDPLPEHALARIGTLRFRSPGHQNITRMGVAFRPDGKTLLSSYWAHGTLHLWDIATGKETRRIPGIAPHFEGDGESGVAISPDGKQIVTYGRVNVGPKKGPRDERVVMWNWDFRGRIASPSLEDGARVF